MARTPTKKTLADFERQRARKNERQREYRHEHPQMQEIWRLRSAANLLRRNGWTVTPPPDFPSLEEARAKQTPVQELDSDPEDLSFLLHIPENELPL